MKVSLPAIVVASLVALGTAPSFARPASPPPHLLRVTSCEPSHGSLLLPGYVPGYYPMSSYYWPDMYGYRYYQPPIRNGATLAIAYSNQTNEVMTEIEFGLVAKGTLVAEVRDVGTFSPGAEIKHEFGLNPNVFPLGTALARCVPLHIKFANGKIWKNPHLPALRKSLYERPGSKSAS